MNNIDNDNRVSSNGVGKKLTKIRKIVNLLATKPDWETIQEFDRTSKRLDDVIRFLEIQAEIMGMPIEITKKHKLDNKLNKAFYKFDKRMDENWVDWPQQKYWLTKFLSAEFGSKLDMKQLWKDNTKFARNNQYCGWAAQSRNIRQLVKKQLGDV